MPCTGRYGRQPGRATRILLRCTATGKEGEAQITRRAGPRARAPFHLRAELLIDAMTAAAGRAWDATTSEAYWGSWAVLRAR